VQEKSGRIMKEVTETTVLRVSHNIRLDVASYKLTTNTVHEHQQHIDAKDIRNVERVLPVESSDRANGVHCGSDVDLLPSSQYFMPTVLYAMMRAYYLYLLSTTALLSISLQKNLRNISANVQKKRSWIKALRRNSQRSVSIH